MVELKTKQYDRYKESGVEWLGQIPEHWAMKKVKFISKIFNGDSLNESLKKKYESDDLSHLAYISSKDINANTSAITYDNGLRIPKDDAKLKVAPKSSSLLCIEGGSAGRKIAFTNQEVCFVNKLACFAIKKGSNSQYLFFSLKGSPFQTQFKLSMTGMIGGVAISNINNFSIPIPPLKEQDAIVQFLEFKTSKIDEAIILKEQQINLLKERKQIIIHKAVTRGLDDSVNLKDSGVDWIDDIPGHWEVKRVKHLLDERTERSEDGKEPLLMMSQIHGLVVRSDFHSKAEVAQNSEGNKIVKTNDLVFNKLKAHLGVFFKSNIEFDGIVSPDYAVYYSKGIFSDLKFLELLFRNPEYIKEFICRATGIVEGLIRLYTSDLFDIHVAVPPKNEQKKSLEYIETASQKIETAISLKQQEIAKLKEYKSSLINSVVTGKVKVC